MIVLVAKCALKQTKQRRHIDTGLINYRHPQKMRSQLAYSNYLFRFSFFLEILHVQILFLVVHTGVHSDTGGWLHLTFGYK